VQQLANSYHELLEYVVLVLPLLESQANLRSFREFSSKDLRSVGNYSLGRLIGKGSFGKVYLATHKLTNGSKVCTHRESSTRSSPTDGVLGCAQICEQGRLESCARDPPPSSIYTPSYCTALRSYSHRESSMASLGILSR